MTPAKTLSNEGEGALTKLFTDLERIIINFIRKNKNLRMAITIFYNKRTSRGITIPDIKLLQSHSNEIREGLGSSPKHCALPSLWSDCGVRCGVGGGIVRRGGSGNWD